MNEQDFFRWLQGFLDACPNQLTVEQVETLKNKMSTVANKVTPDRRAVKVQEEVLCARCSDLDCTALCTCKKQPIPKYEFGFCKQNPGQCACENGVCSPFCMLCRDAYVEVCMRLVDKDCTCNEQECKSDCEVCQDENKKRIADVRTVVSC